MPKKLLFAVKLAAIALMIFIQTLETKAAWGDFDTSFGFAGVSADTITGYNPRSVTIQPDGKILVTGYRITTFGSKGFFLRRYHSNGQLDTAFGTNGAASGPETNSINTDYRGDKIVVQTDGKIAVAGWGNGFYAVWQFSSSGIKDKTFGENGLQRLTNYPVVSILFPEMNIQSGKLLLSICKEIGGGIYRIALLRLNLNGTTDSTFGNSGESLTERHGIYSSGTFVERNGKITLSGVKFNDLYEKGLERKLANGQTDLSFFPTFFQYELLGSGLVKTANGKYTTPAANLAMNGTVTVGLSKFSSTGIFESIAYFYNGSFNEGCPEVFTKQTDGKVIVQQIGILFRVNAELDASSTETNFCSNLSGITNLARAAIQPDDKMVVAGVYNDYLMLVRLLPD